MSEIASLLFSNEAFYLIFRNRDLPGMEALWASRDDVTCIHPGWNALMTRAEVMESWRGILANAGSPQVLCRGARARITGGTGLVVCYEQVDRDVLVATNLFVKEGAAWKMVHHQAGPCQARPEQLADEVDAPAVQ